MPHVGHFSLSILEAWPHRTNKGHLPAETGSRHPASVMEDSMMEGARKRRPRMAPTEVMRAPRLSSVGTHGCRSSMPRGSVWFRMLTPIRTAIQHPFPEPSNSFGEDGPGLTRSVLESDGFLTEVVERRCVADWNPMTRSSLIIPTDIKPPSPKGRSVSGSFPRPRRHQSGLGPKTALGSTVDRSGARIIAPMRFRRERSSFVGVLLLAMLPGPSQT